MIRFPTLNSLLRNSPKAVILVRNEAAGVEAHSCRFIGPAKAVPSLQGPFQWKFLKDYSAGLTFTAPTARAECRLSK